MAEQTRIRPVVPDDYPQIQDLLDAIYREYGDKLCLHGVDHDLLDLHAHYAAGHFVVLVGAGGEIRGTAAIRAGGATAELKRLYLAPQLRGGGAGRRLLFWAMDAARAAGARRMELWTDIRFERAHRFYEKHGFTRTGQVRTLDDAWEPYTEIYFWRGIE